MKLLDDAKAFVENANKNGSYFDQKDFEDISGSHIIAKNIHREEKRWGDIIGTVYDKDGEYVMITEYVYDEGAEGGDLDLDAYAVEPEQIIATRWKAI